MASLKECRVRAKKIGLTVVKLPEKHKTFGKGYRYRVNHFYAKSVADLSKAITIEARDKKKSEMLRKLNGHRPKHGYKTVPRKSRKK